MSQHSDCRVQLVSWYLFLAALACGFVFVPLFLFHYCSDPNNTFFTFFDSVSSINSIVRIVSLFIWSLLVLNYFFSHAVNLSIGLDQSISVRHRIFRTFSWLMTWSGLIGLFVFEIYEVVSAVEGIVHSEFSLLVIRRSLIVLTFLGILLIYAGRPALRYKKTRNDRVYLAGAHPGFLPHFQDTQDSP